MIVLTFRLNLRVFDASVEGLSDNFEVSCTETAHDVIIFKFQGGNCPRLPPPPGAYALNRCRCHGLFLLQIEHIDPCGANKVI